MIPRSPAELRDLSIDVDPAPLTDDELRVRAIAEALAGRDRAGESWPPAIAELRRRRRSATS